MSNTPTILVHSGNAEENVAVAAALAAAHPELTILTANSEREVSELLPAAEVLFAWQFPMHLLSLGKNLRWFQVMGAGVEKLRAEDLPDGVTLTNMRGIFGAAMAEYCLTYMLANAQSVAQVLRQQADHTWERFAPRLLAGATVGIIGTGSIGSDIAGRCRALGMRVFGANRSGQPVEGFEQVWPAGAMDDMLTQCDYLVSVVPQTPETTGLLNAERLSLLPAHCFYINIGRSNIVDLGVLRELLNASKLAGAALDVFPTEPLSADDPLWDTRNLFITPHISGMNRPEDVTGVFLENLARYRAGEPLQFQVDLRQGY